MKEASPSIRWRWVRPLLQGTGRWVLVLGGTAGVAWLLMVLAGYFHPKVPAGRQEGAERLAPGAAVATVRRERRPRIETAVGEIRPVLESAVAARIVARVTEVLVRAGQPVEAGDVLVRLDDEDLRARLRQAESQLQSAEAMQQQAASDFARAERLAASNALSRAEYDAAQAALRAADAEVRRASDAVREATIVLDYALIRAPFSGTVVEKMVEPGDTAMPGRTLLTLYDPRRMQLVASVRESLALGLRPGQELQARLDALGLQCHATISEVVPQADSASRSFLVKVSGPCPDGVYSGMFGRLLLPVGEEELVLVPAAAVRRVGQLTLVQVVGAGGTIARRNVRLGRELGTDFEVLSGLEPGEQVLIGDPGAIPDGNGSTGEGETAGKERG